MTLHKPWWTYGPTLQWRSFRLYGETPNGKHIPIKLMQVVGGKRWSISITRTGDPQT